MVIDFVSELELDIEQLLLHVDLSVIMEHFSLA